MTSDNISATCALCDSTEGLSFERVENEETGELKAVYLCSDHYDKMMAYNEGDDVEF